MLNVQLNIDPIVWKRSPGRERSGEDEEGNHTGSSTAPAEASTDVPEAEPSTAAARAPGEDVAAPTRDA
ncbi:MAG: hypothetical protein AAGF11_12435 [Myxococcota bacterium]